VSEFASGYAGWYDTLYREKDYAAECAYLEALFARLGLAPKTIIDLGCGTGGHALLLVQRGYRVTAVDRSPAMIDIAKKKAPAGANLSFVVSDIAAFVAPEPADAVISMFAVASYQTGAVAFLDFCRKARQSLRPGGLFIFDCWHGPAVLKDPPQKRRKETVSASRETIIRQADPEIDFSRHLVRVHYDLQVFRAGAMVERTAEDHIMRYFFIPETRLFLEEVGFSEIRFFPFLGLEREPGETDWTMTVVAR